MPSAFISHSSHDDRYVAEFVQLVRSLGFDDVFNDSHTIEPDEKFWPRIEKGIANCDAFVVILSHASVKSYWVDREVQYARSLGKRVIPIRIDDCKLPDSFDGRDVIELRQGRGDRVKIASSRLTRHAARNFFGRETELELIDKAWEDSGTHVLSLVAWGGVGKTALVTQWLSTRMIAKGWPGVERYFDWSFYSQGTGETRQTSSDLFINAALTFFGDPDPTKGTPWERGERLAGLIRQHKTLLVLDGIEPLQYPPTDRAGQAGRLKDTALEALLQSLAQSNNGLCIVTSREHLANIDSFPTQKEHKLEKLMLEAAISVIRHLQLIGSDKEIEEMWDALDGHALSILQLGRLLARGYGKDLRKWREIGITKADKLHQGRSTMRVMAKYESWLLSGDKERQLELAILRLMGLFEKPMSPGCFAALRAEPTIVGLTELFSDTEPFEVEAAVATLIENELLSHGGGDEYVGSLLDVPLDAHPLIREYFAAQLKREQPEAFRAAHSRLFDYLCENTPHQPEGLDGLAPLYEAVTHGCLAGRHQEACEEVYRDRILRGTGSDGFYSTSKLGAIGADLAAVAAFFDVPWSQVSPNLSEADQAWLLNEAASSLRALGRLSEALQPMRLVLGRDVQQKAWKEAAVSASNLSELEVTLGRLPDAVNDARGSITHADQSGDAFMRMMCRTTAADGLLQSGQRDEAGGLFAEAERMQQEIQPQFDLLYSLRGFQYCDWMLAPAEQSAWRRISRSMGILPVESEHERNARTTILANVERRATKTLAWVTPQNWLLDIALDHLTLARVGLIRAILEVDSKGGIGIRESEAPTEPRIDGLHGSAGASPSRNPPTTNSFDMLEAYPTNCNSTDGLEARPTLASLDLPHVAAAVNGLRAAGTADHLPRGLLTAALYHFVRGEHALAEKHLAEAQQIAERGPMPLFLADIHLHRARMFRDRDELDKAATLIRSLAYGRRYEELADVEAALATPSPFPARLTRPTANTKDKRRSHSPSPNRKAFMSSTKTVLELDLVGYSDKARELEEHLGVELVMQFNDQIKEFILNGLTEAGVAEHDAIMQSTGDGAIIVLNTAEQAHRLAEAVNAAVAHYNQSRTVESARRWFRIAAATGEITIRGKDLAGTTIANSVRLESAGEPGHFLVDLPTWNALPAKLQSLYLPVEEIRGKRDELIPARRCVFNSAPRPDHVELTLKLTRAEFTDLAAKSFIRELAGLLKVDATKISLEGIREGSVELRLRFRDTAALADFITRHISNDPELQSIFDAWHVESVRYHARMKTSGQKRRDTQKQDGEVNEDDFLAELTKLPGPWFKQLVFKFDKNNAVPEVSAQSDRAIELLKVLRVIDPGLHKAAAEIKRLKDQHS